MHGEKKGDPPPPARLQKRRGEDGSSGAPAKPPDLTPVLRVNHLPKKWLKFGSGLVLDMKPRSGGALLFGHPADIEKPPSGGCSLSY